MDSWLKPHLSDVLRRGLPVLRHWRYQANLSGRVKNLENWILVELNHRLTESGSARVVLTNGFFGEGQDVLAPKRVASNQVSTLHGRKSKATYLSADLSVRPSVGPDEYWIAELKTGLSAVELLDDLRLVRFYRQRKIATRAELGRIVLLPENETTRRACERTLQKIIVRLQAEPGGCTVLTERIDDWLLGAVVIPNLDEPPNTALEPTARATGA